MSYIILAQAGTIPQSATSSAPLTDSIRITVKSYIAPIGSRIGSIPCVLRMPSVVPLPGPLPDIPIPRVPVPLTTPRLSALAAATDAAYSENPLNDRMDRRYRLFTQCTFQVACQAGRLISVTPSVLSTDVGMEGPLTPPPLIASSVRINRDANGFVFAWIAKGRPHQAAEPAFTLVCDRTSVYIWHTISGRIDCRGQRPAVTSLILRGSRFPSHRAFVNGAIHTTIPQGVFSNLWVPTPGDPTRVM